MMQNARKQAETYVFLLDADHVAPPFLIVCDVGNVFELYADFTGTGRAYSHFPDRKGFRIYLEDLRKPEIRERLVAVWTDPQSLDPTKKAARVTREIAKRLAEVSKALEKSHPREEVAHFLMRCIFTMFAEDVDLLPKGAFSKLLEDCVETPAAFAPLLNELWAKMDEKDHDKRFYSAFRTHLRYFNGNLFKKAKTYPLGREEIGELLAASKAVWTEVDPAIFGTLLEQALDPVERKKLGAHYTPRAYVERLVDVTVMEPLRADWQAALIKAEQAKDQGDDKRAVEIVRAFLHTLCATRVLDPACGTGNFLYVALELMKRLEGDVLETLAKLGEPESMGLDRETVDPHQFLGLELNPRAAAIAELVVWIGYLQWHYRTRTGHPSEPILRAFKNINFGKQERYDAVLTWDGYPVPKIVQKDGKRVEIYPNARRPEWPDAEFIVGNPPFISNREMRLLLGDAYVDQLKPAYPEFVQAADFVLFFWIRSTEQSNQTTRRIGLVSTSRIRMPQNNAVFRKAMSNQWHVRFAIPDHDWPDTGGGASVRVAFIMLDRQAGDSTLTLAPDHGAVSGKAKAGDYQSFTASKISSTLDIDVDMTVLTPLVANAGTSHAGVKPYARTLHIDAKTRIALLTTAERRKYAPMIYNGHDVGQGWRGLYVIDVNGLTEAQVRIKLPRLYNYLLDKVKPERKDERNTRLRNEFWRFEANRTDMRDGLNMIDRYIATLENSPQRYFVFIKSSILPDQKLRVMVSDDAYILGVLSSSCHQAFSVRVGGRAGKANTPVYNTACLTTFPFPDGSEPLRQKLRDAGEELDATRKRVQAEHADLPLTGLYNVLEKIKAGAPLTENDEDVKQRGLVLILKELHETIDRLTFDAYGWPHDLTDEQILERLVALNAERAKEEAAGHVRWLRPDYQIPRFGKGLAAKTGDLDLAEAPVASVAAGLPAFPSDPYEQPLAVEAALASAGRAMTAVELAAGFKGRAKGRGDRIAQVLATLARYGRVTPLPDGGYAARRAA